MSAVLPRLEATLAENPDLAYSRLVCPRRLEPNTAYHAFLVPTFETGRLAGLGLDPAGAPNATHVRLGRRTRAAPSRQLCPYYYRWYFRTGAIGDFEYLVRLLKPQPVDPRVGTRDMDVQDPGSNLPGIDRPGARRRPAARRRAAGARRRPRPTTSRPSATPYENWDKPYPARRSSARSPRFVNLADDYAAQTAAAANARTGLGPASQPTRPADHAAALRALARADRSGCSTTATARRADTDDNWVHELNLDPRFRVAGRLRHARGPGPTRRTYMDAAWEQIGDVLEANRAHPRGCSSRASSRPSGTHAHLAPLVARRRRSARSPLTAPRARRVLRRRRRPSRHASVARASCRRR